MLGTSWLASLVIKASVRRTWTQKSRKLERDRIWFGTMKCPASVSVSTEAARNHSSSSIAATTDNVSSGSEQLRDGHLREPADGRRSYVRPSTGITIQSFTITNAKRLSQWKASSN